jgi:hypothetical protein
MELTAQISYKGYPAEYKLTSFDSVYFYAELTCFSGAETESAPDQINFIKVNGRAIANSDVIELVRELVKDLSPDSREHHEPVLIRKSKDIEL